MSKQLDLSTISATRPSPSPSPSPFPSPYPNPNSDHVVNSMSASLLQKAITFPKKQEPYQAPEVVAFDKNEFQYTIKLLRDRFLEGTSLLVECEHEMSKRMWRLRIDDTLTGSSVHKIHLKAETVFKIFQNYARNNNQNDAYSVQFPEKQKDEKSNLMILIDIHHQISEIC